MATLPLRTAITGSSTTNAQQKTNLGDQRDFIADLLGTDSANKPAARAALGAASTDAASATAAGLVELLTAAELRTGTDTTRAPTAAGILSAFGFSASYDSGNQTVTSGGTLTLAHGLGRSPKLVQPSIIFTVVSTGGFPQDRELLIPFGASDSATDNHGASISWDATNIYVNFGTATDVFVTLTTSGVGASFPNSSIVFVVRALA